jgi:hypothetical protein
MGTLRAVSSRQEEKEQRKRERLERERAEQQAAKRKRLVQIIGGVVLGAAIVVGVVLALAGGGGDDERDDSDLKTTAAAAGCQLRSFPNYGQAHVAEKRTAKDYKTNPPTSGDHNVTPAPDGVYAPGNEPEIENWVHTLEHGRILFMYKKDTPNATIAVLQKLFNENAQGKPAYHSVLMQNNTDMSFEVAAVAWRNYLGCPKYSLQAVEAMRAFRDVYVDTAPEQVP